MATRISLFVAILANVTLAFILAMRDSKRKGFKMGAEFITYAMNAALCDMLREKSMNIDTSDRFIRKMNYYLGTNNANNPIDVEIEKAEDFDQTDK